MTRDVNIFDYVKIIDHFLLHILQKKIVPVVKCKINKGLFHRYIKVNSITDMHFDVIIIRTGEVH